MVKKGLALILSHNIKWFINKHFSNHFVQPVNSSKKSILNLVKKLNFIHLFFFFFFVLEIPLRDFPFYSSVLLTLWFRYLQTRIKESCMYLSSQIFYKTPHETLKFLEKSKKNTFSSDLQT